MTSPSDLTSQRAAEINMAIAAATGSYASVPTDLPYRVEALLGATPIVFADSSLDRDGDFRLQGHVVLFTEAHVVLATVHERASGAPTRASSVTVEMWSRKALRSVVIEGEPGLNTDERWAEVYESWRPDTRVALYYDGRDAPLHLPLRTSNPLQQRRADLAAVLPGLLQDL